MTCSNVKTEINFGHVLWFPTFATLTLRFISREFPLQLSAGANKTFSSKVQGAGRGLLWWVTGSCPPVCPPTTRARTTDPASGGETLTLLYLILMFTNCFIIELAVLSSRPDSVDLVSPLTKPEEGGVSNIQDKWSSWSSSAWDWRGQWTPSSATKEACTEGWGPERISSTTRTQSAGVKMTKKPSVTEPVVQGADSGNTQVSDIGGLSIKTQGVKC